jgi:hypothetical protein
MSKIIAQESARINAPTDLVYSIIADYQVGHQNIIPKKYFTSYKVEKGGYGEGTEIRFSTLVMGRTINSHQRIREPEPGKVLVEEDIDNDRATEFFVEPKSNGTETEVTIKTSWTPKGINGFFERFMAPPVLRKIYREELGILNNYAAQKNAEVKVHLN